MVYMILICGVPLVFYYITYITLFLEAEMQFNKIPIV